MSPSGRIKGKSQILGSTTSWDAIVIGGGVIGTSIAVELAERGHKVALVERDKIGAEASTAAIGGLTPQSDDFCRGSLRHFALESVRRYPGWLDHLREITGVSVEFQDRGLLQVAFSPTEMAALEKKAQTWKTEGFDFSRLEPLELLDREPMLNKNVLGGYHLPGEPWIEPAILMDALGSALARTGCDVVLGKPVAEIVHSATTMHGVRLTGGEMMSAERVIIATGAWGATIGGVAPWPVEPVKGQAMLVKAYPQRFRHHIYAAPGYIVPRSDGRVVLGVTYEFAGFDKRVTVEGLSTVLRATLRISNSLRNCEVIRFWSGLRPRTPDERPIIGPSSCVPGLYFATGHFGVGITLAPITAQIVADLIDGKNMPSSIDDYSPKRFKL